MAMYGFIAYGRGWGKVAHHIAEARTETVDVLGQCSQDECLVLQHVGQLLEHCA